jgi:DNA repair exonuclease SbcCD ATPase subunit
MASPADAKMHNAAGKEAPEGANVDKIRDILFGSQMRDYEKRFTRLEDNVTKAIENLREDMTKRLDTLGGFVRQEVDSLSQRIKSEKAERSEGLKETAREIKDGAKILEKKLSQLEEQMSDGQGELRAKLLEHSKAISADIDKLRRETAAALNREVEVLRDEKTDRAGLADLFSEFSLRLKNKLELPEE